MGDKMGVKEIITLLSGVALFLFGMGLMGDGLKKVSGNKLEPILYRLSSTTLKGVVLGTGVTAVIQSSCATAVMTVGFVNSGMMKVRQAVGVVLGAVLGTSVTGWVLCLSYIEGAGSMAELISTTTLTGIVAVAGTLLRMLGKKQTSRFLGDILLGFAVLMFGMSAMSGSVSGLGKEAWFTDALTTLSNPILGILIGIVFTALLQSASAAVGIVQALSVTGAIAFDTALPLLMGITVGAAVPVLFSAIGANVGGRRAALIYPVGTVFGVLICAAVWYIANAIFRFSFTSWVLDPFSMALVNSLLRLAIVLILLPFTDVIEAVVTALVKDKGKTEKDPGFLLEERFIAHPALAIEQSRLTINEMAALAQQTLEKGLALLTAYSPKGFAEVEEMESRADEYEDSLGTYLVKLTGHELTSTQNEQISEYLHTLSDFERISDHALNLAESAREIMEKDVHFSPSALKELDTLRAAVTEVVTLAITAFRENDLQLAARVEPLEELIDTLCDKMKFNHVERLQRGDCTISQGFVFNDIVTNCERVSDHCSNIAVAMIELSDDEFQTHEYILALKEKETPEFIAAYEQYAEKYAI